MDLITFHHHFHIIHTVNYKMHTGCRINNLLYIEKNWFMDRDLRQLHSLYMTWSWKKQETLYITIVT